MKKSRHYHVILILCILSTFALLLSCGSNSSSSISIDGRYLYEDSVSRSVVTISGSSWSMKTQFGAPGYYGSDAKYDHGELKGNTLYHSGFIPYGKVSNNTVTIGFRKYYKQ